MIYSNQKDVYISDKIKEILFKDNDKTPLKQLVSMEQRQSILFHFFKNTFTNFILDKLQPKYFNISCKDAIDRAGVHNLWNILCNEIDRNKSFSICNFEKLLNLPAILVKDRPINHHLHIITN